MAFFTPRPMPDRRLGAVAGGFIVLLALPIFLIAGWEMRGWALGAVVWAGSQGLGYLLHRAGIGQPNLAGSGVFALGSMGRGVALMVVLIVVAAIDPTLGLAGALVYAAGYTVELVFSLTTYFAGGAKQ